MNHNDLHALFLDELSDLLGAEKSLVKALPKMADAARADDLKEAFTSHLEETKGHVARLRDVFESVGAAPTAKTCEAMEGLLEEGSQLINDFKHTDACDAALIAAAQKVEHYEIASYGTLRTFAKLMGHDEAVTLLQETLDEESAADRRLTEIAESEANETANA